MAREGGVPWSLHLRGEERASDASGRGGHGGLGGRERGEGGDGGGKGGGLGGRVEIGCLTAALTAALTTAALTAALTAAALTAALLALTAALFAALVPRLALDSAATQPHAQWQTRLELLSGGGVGMLAGCACARATWRRLVLVSV